MLAERRESEEHCKLLLLAQREKNKREEENRWEEVFFVLRNCNYVLWVAMHFC